VFDDVVLVHGGFSPIWEDPIATLQSESAVHPGSAASFAVSVRTCDSRGETPAKGTPRDAPPFQPWHSFFDRTRVLERTVVFGHWAAQGLFVPEGYRGLDSGCVWGGALSAWIAEEDRIVQVPAARSYARVR
jgi:hypothetical protein